jgi:hypothetical protein
MLEDNDLPKFFACVGSTPIYFFDDLKEDTIEYYPPSIFVEYTPTMLFTNNPNPELTPSSSAITK